MGCTSAVWIAVRSSNTTGPRWKSASKSWRMRRMKGRSKTYRGPRWPDLLEGEILKSPGGVLRVARAVRKCSGRVYVNFVILHASWTTRCHTVYTTNELFSIGYRRTGKHVHSFDEFEQAVADEMKHCYTPPKIHAKDVAGLR